MKNNKDEQFDFITNKSDSLGLMAQFESKAEKKIVFKTSDNKMITNKDDGKKWNDS